MAEPTDLGYVRTTVPHAADNPVPAYGGDTRSDDLDFNPALEPNKSKAWLNLLDESEDAFQRWFDTCDRLEKLYANLERLSNVARDKEFQMFWANMELIKPTIYSRPPVPVVAPKFADRRPVYDAAAEMLERCCIVAFDLTFIDAVMKLIRDDVALIGRGVPWVRYESKKDNDSYYNTERVVIDYKNRNDFLHSLSRNWMEVTWVAGASYLTRSEARDRFYEASGDAYQTAEYRVDRDTNEVGGTDNRERAKFWEIWDATERRVIWVAKGVEVILDEDDAHLDLSGFFPCPCPAYGTVQRNSLVPVPDVMQYRDQLDEINLLTGRIHALSDALEAKGFYPAGGAELSDAVQAAVRQRTAGRMLVPISNWAAFGGSKEVIIWLPIDMIANTITQCVTLREQIIQDIYQITGLSDIQRGATDPNETLGAQQIKTEYGSARISDKQDELVRVARDLVNIVAEVMLDKFDTVTLVEMSQTQLPTREMQKKQIEQVRQQMENQQKMLQIAQAAPQFQQAQQQNPQQAGQLTQAAQQAIQSGQETIKKIMDQPTVDQVIRLLRDNRTRSFVLDIETDSTIQIDENTEKQRRAEFVGVLAQLLPQLAQLIQVEPASADFCAALLKFATAPYRAGRSLDSAIDSFADTITAKAGQPQGPDPTTAQNQTALQIEQMKDQRERQRDKTDAELKAAELKMRDAHAKAQIASHEQIEMAKLQARQGQDSAKQATTAQKMMHDNQEHQAHMVEIGADIIATREKAQQQAQLNQQKQVENAQRAMERRAALQFRQQQGMQRPGGMPR